MVVADGVVDLFLDFIFLMGARGEVKVCPSGEERKEEMKIQCRASKRFSTSVQLSVEENKPAIPQRLQCLTFVG